MKIECLAQGQYTAAASRFEPGTSRLRVRGLISTAPNLILDLSLS